MNLKTGMISAITSFCRPGWRARAVAGLFSGGLKIFRPRGGEARENLKSVYPEATDDWIRGTVNGVYEHLSWMVAECLALQRDPRLSLEWMKAVEGKEILDSIKAAGRGAIILTGHVGNWELLAAWLAQSGYPLSAVVRSPDDADFSRIIASFRSRTGVGVFEKHFVMKETIRFARNGGFLGLMPDQAWNSTGIPTEFLGRRCYTAGGPAAIARLAGVPVVPVASYRVAPFRHEVRISEPIKMVEGADKQRSIKENTDRMNRAIEKMILEHPEQWLWLHRRWRF